MGYCVCNNSLCVENTKSPEVYKARYEATAALLEQAKDLAATMQPKDKDEILKLVAEIEALNDELRKLEESGQVCVCVCVCVCVFVCSCGSSSRLFCYSVY